MRSVKVIELETTLGGFTSVALMTIGIESFASNGVLVATVAAQNGDGYHTVKMKSPQYVPTGKLI